MAAWRMVDVDPDARGIARLFLEKFEDEFSTVHNMLKAQKNKLGMKQWTAFYNTLQEIPLQPQVDCVPLHNAVRQLGKLTEIENKDMVVGRMRSKDKYAVRRYCEKKYKTEEDLDERDWKRIVNYQNAWYDFYEESKERANMLVAMQKDLVHMLNLMGAPVPRLLPPGNSPQMSL